MRGICNNMAVVVTSVAHLSLQDCKAVAAMLHICRCKAVPIKRLYKNVLRKPICDGEAPVCGCEAPVCDCDATGLQAPDEAAAGRMHRLNQDLESHNRVYVLCSAPAASTDDLGSLDRQPLQAHWAASTGSHYRQMHLTMHYCDTVHHSDGVLGSTAPLKAHWAASPGSTSRHAASTGSRHIQNQRPGLRLRSSLHGGILARVKKVVDFAFAFAFGPTGGVVGAGAGICSGINSIQSVILCSA
jgi:hypothetical protein